MDIIDKAYIDGMAETFRTGGLSKSASYDAAVKTASLVKRASLFNFGNSPYDGGGPSISSILIPLIAAGLTGYFGYQAGLQGSRNRSAFSNVKNYLGRTLSKFTRNTKPPALFDYTSMIP